MILNKVIRILIYQECIDVIFNRIDKNLNIGKNKEFERFLNRFRENKDKYLFVVGEKGKEPISMKNADRLIQKHYDSIKDMFYRSKETMSEDDMFLLIADFMFFESIESD